MHLGNDFPLVTRALASATISIPDLPQEDEEIDRNPKGINLTVEEHALVSLKRKVWD